MKTTLTSSGKDTQKAVLFTTQIVNAGALIDLKTGNFYMTESPLIIKTETINLMTDLIKACEEQGYPVSHFSISDGDMQMFLKPISVGTTSTEEET